MANFRQIYGASWDLLHVPLGSPQHLHGPQWLLREWLEVLTTEVTEVTQVKQFQHVSTFNSLFPVPSILTDWWHSDQHQTATKISRLEESQTLDNLDGMGIRCTTPIPQVYYFQVFFGSYGVLHHQFWYRHMICRTTKQFGLNPTPPNLWWLFCFTMCFSMDWFKGKITGKPLFFNGKIYGFRLRFSLKPIHCVPSHPHWKTDENIRRVPVPVDSTPKNIAAMWSGEAPSA